jgi:hypothetical protein
MLEPTATPLHDMLVGSGNTGIEGEGLLTLLCWPSGRRGLDPGFDPAEADVVAFEVDVLLSMRDESVAELLVVEEQLLGEEVLDVVRRRRVIEACCFDGGVDEVEPVRFRL